MARTYKYKTKESLQKVIDAYFDSTPFEEWTITGLALKVGSKQTIDDYQKRPEYADVVKRAKLMVENAYEVSLRKNGKAGDIFALKNFGWKDKHDIESTGSLTVTISKEAEGF